MDVTILCVGDVVGSPGRRALRDGLQRLRQDRKIDFVLVNAENVAGGSGITAALYEKILQCDVDAVTLGDHIYRRKDIIPTLEKSDRIVRPANLPPTAPGKTVCIQESSGGHRVACVSVLGRLYMKTLCDCPFRTMNQVLSSLPQDVKIIIVDMHAEATSEKVAMGWHLDGRVSIVFGTHTHVPTADERVLPGGTAHITDVGMTGPYDSILGRRKDRVLNAMVNGIPSPFDVADGDLRMCGILATVDSTTGRAKSVERVCLCESNGWKS